MPYADTTEMSGAERRRQRSRAYYAANRDRYSVRSKRRREGDPKAHRERLKDWGQRNPDLHLTGRRRRQATRRARKVDAFVESVDPQIVFTMHGGCCGICHEFIEGEFHVDHKIPLACGGEHSYANSQPAHPLCNVRKGALV